MTALLPLREKVAAQPLDEGWRGTLSSASSRNNEPERPLDPSSDPMRRRPSAARGNG